MNRFMLEDSTKQNFWCHPSLSPTKKRTKQTLKHIHFLKTKTNIHLQKTNNETLKRLGFGNKIHLIAGHLPNHTPMPNQPPIPSKGCCPEIALGHFQANSLPTVLEDQPEAPRLVGWNRPNIEPQTKRLGWLEFRPFFVAKCVVVRFLFTWKKGKIMEKSTYGEEKISR